MNLDYINIILCIFLYWFVVAFFCVYCTCTFCLNLCIYHVYMHVYIFFLFSLFFFWHIIVWFDFLFFFWCNIFVYQVLNVLRHHWVSEVNRNRQPRVSLLWASILRRLLCFLLYESALQVLSGQFKDPNTQLNSSKIFYTLKSYKKLTKQKHTQT